MEHIEKRIVSTEKTRPVKEIDENTTEINIKVLMHEDKNEHNNHARLNHETKLRATANEFIPGARGHEIATADEIEVTKKKKRKKRRKNLTDKQKERVREYQERNSETCNEVDDKSEEMEEPYKGMFGDAPQSVDGMEEDMYGIISVFTQSSLHNNFKSTNDSVQTLDVHDFGYEYFSLINLLKYK